MSIKKPSLANVLFSQTQQRVLGLLYGQPDRDFYTNEIIRLSESGTGAIQRELSKLTATGFISVSEQGNQKRYQANREMPFFSELRSIILKTFGLADIIKKELIPISKGISIAFIYGSVAKQEDSAKSDIDLILITDTLSYSDFFKKSSKLEHQLNRKINPTFYTNDEWVKKQNGGNHFVLRITKQPKIFLIGTQDELKAIGKPCENRPIKK